ncbi:uncharacterized [Tachysurus ichikawai]
MAAGAASSDLVSKPSADDGLLKALTEESKGIVGNPVLA